MQPAAHDQAITTAAAPAAAGVSAAEADLMIQAARDFFTSQDLEVIASAAGIGSVAGELRGLSGPCPPLVPLARTEYIRHGGPHWMI